MTIVNDGLTIATIVACGVVTLLVRASFVIWHTKLSVPPWFTRSLKFVAAAVLPALVMPEVLFRGAAAGDVVNYYRIIAAALALIVAWRSRHLLATLVVGMIALWVLQWLKPF
jgi:branched-subunit amino acid transport protein